MGIFLGCILGRIWGRAEELCKKEIQHTVGAHVMRPLELLGRAHKRDDRVWGQKLWARIFWTKYMFRSRASRLM